LEKLREWLKKDNSGLLHILSEYFPCGIVLRWASRLRWSSGSFWSFAGGAAICAVVAMVCVLVTRQMLGESPTNWKRLKAIAVELVLAWVVFTI